MSSPGRYQSRVFNLFSRQILHWREETARALRRAKVATVWSAQVVLYPVYALFQATRVASRQFQQTVRRVLPRLQAAKEGIQQEVDVPSRSHLAPTVDTPIHRALLTVQGFDLPIQVQSIQTATLPGTANSKALPSNSTKKGRLALFRRGKTAIAPTSPQPDGILVPVQPTDTALAEPSHLDPETAIAASSPTTLAQQSGGTAAVAANDQSPLDLESSSPQGTALVRGVASLLGTQTLVLVTVENDVLDILSPDQQQQLRQRIIWEVANYWRHQRVLYAANHPHLSPLPPPVDEPHLLPPVRVFRRLMAWMQVSSVAIAINLFQESALVPYSPSPSPDDNPSSAASASDGGDRSWLDPFPLQRSLPMPTDLSPFQEEELAWEQYETDAIGPMSSTNSTSALAASGESRLQRFLRSSRAVIQANRSSQALSYQPQSTELRSAISLDSPPVAQTGVTPSNELSPVGSSSETALSPSEPDQSLERSISDETAWIDIQATVVGYVKHPLEQVLEWLDQGMSWLEEHLAMIWKWVRDRL